ncbi:MAG: hypothetical protein QOF48_1519 [Verrucomicrobiota bacterium]|jgi:hypothetical protein
MKIHLTPSQASALKATRAKVAKLAADTKADTATVSALEAELERLPGEIEEGESAVDPSDDAALTAIALKKTKLSAVGRKLDEFQSTDSGQVARRNAALQAASAIVDGIIAPIAVDVERRIATYLAVVLDPAHAPVEARNSASVRTLAYFRQCQFTGMADAGLACQEALRVIDILLSGELSFIRLPEPTPKSHR